MVAIEYKSIVEMSVRVLDQFIRKLLSSHKTFILLKKELTFCHGETKIAYLLALGSFRSRKE